MAKITRIKATDPNKPKEKDLEKDVISEAEIVKKASKKASDEKKVEKSKSGASDEKASKKAVKVELDEKTSKKAAKEAKKAEKKAKKAEKEKNKKPMSKPVCIITAPFRYLSDSWHELRQVRWPNRKATWKMVFAIFIYTALFFAFIMLLDVFFTWLFNLIIG